MKIFVSCSINYNFETEIEDTINGEPITPEDIVSLADWQDPVYSKMGRILYENNLDYDGNIIAISNAETGEEIWVM